MCGKGELAVLHVVFLASNAQICTPVVKRVVIDVIDDFASWRSGDKPM
jgi:hypothetical protein